jgi:hypothetical protein
MVMMTAAMPTPSPASAFVSLGHVVMLWHSKYAGWFTSESFLEVGRQALRQGGVDVEELRRYVRRFFLPRVWGCAQIRHEDRGRTLSTTAAAMPTAISTTNMRRRVRCEV